MTKKEVLHRIARILQLTKSMVHHEALVGYEVLDLEREIDHLEKEAALIVDNFMAGQLKRHNDKTAERRTQYAR